MKTLLVFVFLLVSLVDLPSRAQDSAKAPVNPQSGRIQNITPEARPTAKIPLDEAAFLDGMHLNEDQVAAVEKTLDTSPDDPNAHLKLLGYYSMRKNAGEGDEHSDFAKYLLWMVDHRPESAVFEPGMIQLNWEPSPTLYNEYRKHWEEAAVAHPKDFAVLSHTAEAVSPTDPILGLSYAQKSVDANGSCTRCRNVLGTIIGQIILRQSQIPRSPKRGWERKCLPNTPQAEQTVSDLRKEIEASNDPEILVDCGLTLKGEGWAGTNCGVDSEKAVQFGGELIRKAVSLDPSLIDRRHLQGILKSSNAQVSPNRPANVESKRIQNIPPEEMWKRVRECVFPIYAAPFHMHITGTVDIGLSISPDGDVANYRVLDGTTLFIQPAIDAIRQWKFQPNVVQGEVSWSRIRALVRFNADGTTAIDLANAILSDNFGNPGIPSTDPAARMASAVPRPASSPECKAVLAPLLGDSSTAAQQLLLTAKQQASLIHKQASPFQLDVDFVAQINVPIQGHLTLKWEARDRWWRKIVMGVFEQTEIRNGDRLYTSRNISFTPLRVGELISLLQFAERSDGLLAKKQKQSVENGVEMICLQAEQGFSVKPHETCINSPSLEILRDEWHEPPDQRRREEYADYFDFEGHRYPRKLQLLVNGSKVITANVVNLTSAAFDHTLLVAPKGAIERRQCTDMKPPIAIDKPNPMYPKSANQNKLMGDTTVAMTVLTDGSVGDIQLIGGATRSMDDATLQTLKRWRFKPAMCGADPVVSDIGVVVSFRLR